MENNNFKITKITSRARIALYFVIIFSLISLVTGLVLTYDTNTSSFDIGRLIRERNSQEKKILYKGDHIVLYDSLSFNISDPSQKQKKIDFELGMEALYYLAQKEGVNVTNEEVKNKIENDRITTENAENYDQFLAMLSGMKMTADEYWSWERLGAVTRKVMTIDKLINHQRDILAKNNINNPEIDINAKLEEWRKETIKKVLDEDNVKKIDS